jgi:hypothetical protein
MDNLGVPAIRNLKLLASLKSTREPGRDTYGGQRSGENFLFVERLAELGKRGLLLRLNPERLAAMNDIDSTQRNTCCVPY